MADRINLGPLTRDEFVSVIESIRDQHGCEPKPYKRTYDRTHKRRVTTLSYWMRHVRGVRSIDVDQLVYCDRCWAPLVWVETKPSNRSEDWQLVRDLARRHDCYAMLGVEPEGRIGNFDAIMIYPRDPRC